VENAGVENAGADHRVENAGESAMDGQPENK